MLCIYSSLPLLSNKLKKCYKVHSERKISFRFGKFAEKKKKVTSSLQSSNIQHLLLCLSSFSLPFLQMNSIWLSMLRCCLVNKTNITIMADHQNYYGEQSWNIHEENVESCGCVWYILLQIFFTYTFLIHSNLLPESKPDNSKIL